MREKRFILLSHRPEASFEDILPDYYDKEAALEQLEANWNQNTFSEKQVNAEELVIADVSMDEEGDLSIDYSDSEQIGYIDWKAYQDMKRKEEDEEVEKTLSMLDELAVSYGFSKIRDYKDFIDYAKDAMHIELLKTDRWNCMIYSDNGNSEGITEYHDFDILESIDKALIVPYIEKMIAESKENKEA